jgi:hypothetical protein
MNKARTQRPISAAQILEFPQGEPRTLFEVGIKDRLQKLTNLVESFSNSTLDLWQTENPSVREAVDELIVSEAALQWITRVAAHSSGSVRERLWADIDRALSDLESSTESVLHAGIHWLPSDSADQGDRAIHLARM